MNYLRFLSFTAAAASVALLSSSADAGWGARSSYGSYGSSYGSYGSSGYSAAYAGGGSSGYASYSSYASHGSSGGSYGSSYASHGSTGGSQGTRVGLLGRLAQRLHAHRAAKQSHRSARYGSGGSSGYSSYYSGGGSSGYSSSYGSRGSYYGSGGSSGYSGSYGSYGSYGGGSSGGAVYGSSMPYYSAGYSRSATGSSYLASSAASEGSESSIAADTALLTISVPDSARVIVNGHQTTSTGPIRQFMSKGLKSGYTYTYEVEVQNDVDGRTVSDRQTVTVRAGQAERLAFDMSATDAVETVVTVRVPANAEVTLAGNPTDAKGEIRTFRTRQLKAGETWDDYSVQVAVMLDGRRVVKEKTISLRAGSQEELDFDFGSPADAVVAVR